METQDQTTAPAVTTMSVGVRYGLFMAGFSIFWFLVMAMSDMRMDGPARWVTVVVSIVLIVLAHLYFKKNGNGFMSFGQGVGIGFWASLVSSAISSVFTFIYVKFVDGTFIEKMVETQRQAMEAKGNMSEEQIDQAMKIASMFMTPVAMLFIGLFVGVLGGVIISLVVSIFTQKSNPETAIS